MVSGTRAVNNEMMEMNQLEMGETMSESKRMDSNVLTSLMHPVNDIHTEGMESEMLLLQSNEMMVAI